MPPPSDAALLARRNALLADQVKLLLKTEQRLNQSQRAAEEQIRRIEIVNRFSLAVAGTLEEKRVLEEALTAVSLAFPYELGGAFLAWGPEALSLQATFGTVRPDAPAFGEWTLPALPFEPLAGPAEDDATRSWMRLVDAVLGKRTPEPNVTREVLVLPVRGQGISAVLAMATSGAPLSPLHPPARKTDAPFLELLTRHIEGALESVALRRRTLDSEALFQTGFTHSTVGMSMVSGDGRFARVNAALERLLGFGPYELLGRSVASVTHPDDLGTIERSLSSARGESEEPLDLDCRCVRRDGTSLWAHLTAVRVAATPTRAPYWFAQFRDLTDRRTLEQTERLASLGQLAAGVAHEVNNPLTYVLFELERLGMETLSSPARISAETALEGARRIQRIVGEMRRFSRVDPVERREPVDLRAVTDSVLSMTAAEFRHRGRVELERHPDAVVLAEEGRVTQIVMNLVLNAVQAMADLPSDPVVRVRTAAEGAMVVLEVTDTGPGIAPGDHARIFEPFYTTKGPGKGSGLGLSIARTIAESYEGSLVVASELGRGTTFTLRLPRAPATLPREHRAPDPPAPVVGRRPRVLVVDDEPHLCQILRSLLEPAHDVVVAEGGPLAQDTLARDARFDCLVCDVMMPGVSGLDLHTWLGARHPALAERTLFITGGAPSAAVRDSLARRKKPVLEKPFTAEALFAAIRNVVGG